MAERNVLIKMHDVEVVRQLNPEFNNQLTIAAMAREDAELRAAEEPEPAE